MVLSRDRNAKQNHNEILIINLSDGRKSSLQIFRNSRKESDSIQEEIKSTLKLRYAYCHVTQNLFSCSFLSKNVKIELQVTIILPVVLCGCEN